MRIAILTSSTGFGGAEVHAITLTRALARRGHDPCIVALGHGYFDAAASAGNLPLKQVVPAAPPGNTSVGAWTRLLRNIDADVAVMQKGWVHTGSLALDLAARCTFARCYSIEHGIAEVPRKSSRSHFGGLVPGLGLWWYRDRLAMRLRFALPRKIICVSDAVRTNLVAYGCPRRKLITVRNGIDATRFQPDDASRARFRKTLGIGDDVLVFGMLGRLSEEKQCHIAVEAVARLQREQPGLNLRLVLAGAGGEENALRVLARNLAAQDIVLFTGFTDRPWEVLSALDVVLMTSRTEAFPLSLCEAMACARACIAMTVGGIPEVIGDSRYAWLVPAQDREAFFATLKTVAGLTRRERSDVGCRARQRIVDNFSEEVQYNILVDLVTGV